MMKYVDWEWVPAVGLGPLKYGDEIADCIYRYSIKLIEPEGSGVDLWGTYKLEDSDKTIWTEEGKIVCLGCDEYFIYKARNLIGMSEDECITHLSRQPTEVGEGVLFDDGTVQVPLEFDEWGLEVWFENNRIVSASAYDPSDD